MQGQQYSHSADLGMDPKSFPLALSLSPLWKWSSALGRLLGVFTHLGSLFFTEQKSTM